MSRRRIAPMTMETESVVPSEIAAGIALRPPFTRADIASGATFRPSYRPATKVELDTITERVGQKYADFIGIQGLPVSFRRTDVIGGLRPYCRSRGISGRQKSRMRALLVRAIKSRQARANDDPTS